MPSRAASPLGRSGPPQLGPLQTATHTAAVVTVPHDWVLRRVLAGPAIHSSDCSLQPSVLETHAAAPANRNAELPLQLRASAKSGSQVSGTTALQTLFEALHARGMVPDM